MGIEVGSIVEGKVTGITKFGAFVELPEGKVGLIHISQVSHTYVTDISQHLSTGQVLRVKVTGVTKDGKYDLSLKQLTLPPVSYKRENKESGSTAAGSFEDKITQFLKKSDEKLNDWKRNLQIKQEGKIRRVKRED